jgi:methyl-accepting chemotaxis protein
MQQRPLWLTVLWPAVLALAVIVLGFIGLQIQSTRHRAELARLEARIDQTFDAAAKSSDVGRLSQAVNDLKGQQRDLQGQIEQARRELKGLASATARIAKTSRDLLDAWSRQNSSALAPDSAEVPAQGIHSTLTFADSSEINDRAKHTEFRKRKLP